jgi:hypothetical protein
MLAIQNTFLVFILFLGDFTSQCLTIVVDHIITLSLPFLYFFTPTHRVKILGCAFYGLLIAQITSIVAEFDAHRRAIAERLDAISAYVHGKDFHPVYI